MYKQYIHIWYNLIYIWRAVEIVYHSVTLFFFLFALIIRQPSYKAWWEFIVSCTKYTYTRLYYIIYEAEKHNHYV